MGLSREQFLNKKNAPTKRVIVDGEEMWVRGLKGFERTAWERDTVKDPDGARGRLVALATIQGETDYTPYFTPKDAKALNDMPSAYTEPLVDGIFECSGMTPAAKADLGKDSATADGSETSTS